MEKHMQKGLEENDYAELTSAARRSIRMTIFILSRLKAACEAERDRLDPEKDWRNYDAWQRRANALASAISQTKSTEAAIKAATDWAEVAIKAATDW